MRGRAGKQRSDTKYRLEIGFLSIGGCGDTTAIVGLAVEPEVACSTFTVNNCNGGILEVDNGCGEVFSLDGMNIEPG